MKETAVPIGTDSPVPARRFGHTLDWDPPAAITAIRRWTCRDCSSTLLDDRGHLYGDAIEQTCQEAVSGVKVHGL